MRLIVFSLILASTLTACDAEVAPRGGGFSPTPATSTCSTPGKAYGPCTAESTCSGDLHCLATVDGDMCVLPSPNGWPAVVSHCPAKLGGVFNCENAGACVLECDVDADCLGGTVCSEIPGVCVWLSSDEGDTSSTG